MKMIYQTRYSYFYPSPGWRSDASKQKEILFDPERLARRQYFFEKVTLRSLADQSDTDFALNVLASDDFPEPFKTQLAELCRDILGDRAHVMFKEVNLPRVHFRDYRWQHLADDPWTTQIVLDDDDALSVDFTEKLRREAIAAEQLRTADEPIACISHANGLTALFRDGQLDLHRLMKPAINLGLAIVAPTKTKHNLFNISHNNVPRDRPTRVLFTQRPYYIRSLHVDNDSRGRYTDDPLSADDVAKVAELFPLVQDLKTDWKTVF